MDQKTRLCSSRSTLESSSLDSFVSWRSWAILMARPIFSHPELIRPAIRRAWCQLVHRMN